MKLLLAPMEGLIDPYLRQLLTHIGGYDWCVSEFIRVTERLLPARFFYRVVPELRQGGATASGTPVYVQLMGNQPSVIVENAQQLVELGAPGIDLNFGCPSPVVNRKGAGASLLQEPDTIHHITASLRRAVPAHIPVTVKMRLGYNDGQRAVEIAQGIESAGATLLTVHARTRADGYRAPARWEALAAIHESITIPVVANGDIVDLESFQQCRSSSGCEHFMLGRGAVRHPFLGRHIREHVADIPSSDFDWQQQKRLLLEFALLMHGEKNQKGAATRVKQWLSMLKKDWVEASCLFDTIKKEKELQGITRLLQAS